MPKKAKNSADLCCKPIVEDLDEALECEGACGKWYHRYCAGIPKTHFERLSKTTTPFVCYPCNQILQETRVYELLSEVKSLKSQLLKLEEKIKLEECQRYSQGGAGTVAARRLCADEARSGPAPTTRITQQLLPRTLPPCKLVTSTRATDLIFQAQLSPQPTVSSM